MAQCNTYNNCQCRRGRVVMDPFNLDMWNSLDLILPIHISVDWLDTDEAHIFKANLPGLKKEDVKVQVEEEHVLVISGEFKKDEVDKNDKWRRLERSHGTFSRRFCLPKNAMLDQVKANLTNGMLSVTIPKVADSKPVVIPIN
ncbi:hypothetical protein SUGI_1086730 [Cryptomeria japonica]|nr:hypothetical protein SUGI_1086730 [Cryptomeria japonica]